MASAMNKKVQAVLDRDTLKISHETIYDQWPKFEIKSDIKTKHEDIKRVYFEDCFMMKVPAAISLLKIAPNFNHLELDGTNLTHIYSEDLRGFEKLEKFYVGESRIEELPADLFVHTPNLQFISFTSNKIGVIGEKILEPLKDLKFFNLTRNPGIDACYDKLFAGKYGYLSLAQFTHAISRCKPVQNVWNTVNEHKNLKRKIEAQEQEMMREITDLKKICAEQAVEINEHGRTLEGNLEGQIKAMDDNKKHCDALEKKMMREIIDLKKLCVDQRTKIEGQKKAIDDIKRVCVDQGAKIEGLEKKLEEAKQDGAFHKFDFTIEINGKTFKVQKEILAANSPLLANLIRDNEDADTLELKDISEDTFEEILNFMVKKTQPKPTANFIEIYAASARLQIKELMDLCARTLMEKINRENSWEILCVSKKYPNKDLEQKAFDEMKKIYEKP